MHEPEEKRGSCGFHQPCQLRPNMHAFRWEKSCFSKHGLFIKTSWSHAGTILKTPTPTRACALLAKKCVQRMHVINCVCRGAIPHDLPSTEKVVRTLEFDQQVAMKKDLMKELAELESLLEKRLRTVELMRMSHHPSIMHEAPCTRSLEALLMLLSRKWQKIDLPTFCLQSLFKVMNLVYLEKKQARTTCK